MKQLLVTALLFLPILPAVAHSQAIAFDQPGPVASITASASYIYGEPQNSRGRNTSLWGWNASPEINVTRQFSMQGDFGNYYMGSVYPGQSRLLMAAGPRYNFMARWHRVTPFAYAEGGEIRVTYQRSSYRDWDPVILVGVGVKYRLTRKLALTFVPGEYLAHNLDWGPWNQNFSTRVGVTYNFFRH